MRRTLAILLFSLVNVSAVVAQEDFLTQRILEMNELILQISTNSPGDILSVQALNRDVNNFVLTSQVGAGNKANIDQDRDACPGLANRSINMQMGNLNDLTVEQAGSGNLFLGFQLGIPPEWLSVALTEFDPGFGDILFEENMSDYNGIFTGEVNKIVANQEGINNTLIALQQGNDHFISAAQKGTCNYLMILQRGAYNSVTGYEQGNVSENILPDRIIQEGENLSISSTGVSVPELTGNTFTQSGTNLSLQVNYDFPDFPGGMEINQTGRDMNVVVNQSHFLTH